MRFYTSLDGIFPERHPYLMHPIHRYKLFFKFPKFKHGILDSGVEAFTKRDDYPTHFHYHYRSIAKYLTGIFGDRMWCVIPDYPDDLRPGEISSTVEKTLKNIEEYHDIDGVNWVYPLQARFLDTQSFRYSCKEVKDYEPERVAIGTVCKTRNLTFIKKCCGIARSFFPNAWIHAFGLTLKALPHVTTTIDSFDSCAYYTSREPGKRMCTNRKQRQEYFKAYLKRIDEILADCKNQPLTKILEAE